MDLGGGVKGDLSPTLIQLNHKILRLNWYHVHFMERIHPFKMLHWDTSISTLQKDNASMHIYDVIVELTCNSKLGCHSSLDTSMATRKTNDGSQLHQFTSPYAYKWHDLLLREFHTNLIQDILKQHCCLKIFSMQLMDKSMKRRLMYGIICWTNDVDFLLLQLFRLK